MATSPSKTSRRRFRFQGGSGAPVARLDGAAPTSFGGSFAGAFFGGPLFDGLPSSDSSTGAPMIPSTLRLALPRFQPVRYIELSDRKIGEQKAQLKTVRYIAWLTLPTQSARTQMIDRGI